MTPGVGRWKQWSEWSGAVLLTANDLSSVEGRGTSFGALAMTHTTDEGLWCCRQEHVLRVW
jgi:hypothetical protein